MNSKTQLPQSPFLDADIRGNLTVTWGQYRVCHNCENRCGDSRARYCPVCSAPWPLAEFKAWKEWNERRAARHWFLRWLP